MIINLGVIDIYVGMSLEDYLESILIISKAHSGVRSVQVAEHMGVSKASVCNAVRSLRKKGCLKMGQGKLLYLTPEGQEIGERIYEKHCFFRKLLISCGVEERLAAHDACRIEHAISNDAFDKLRACLELDEDE